MNAYSLTTRTRCRRSRWPHGQDYLGVITNLKKNVCVHAVVVRPFFACSYGVQVESFKQKNNGRKSCDAIPLILHLFIGDLNFLALEILYFHHATVVCRYCALRQAINSGKYCFLSKQYTGTQKQYCARKHSAWLSAVPGSTQPDSATYRAAFSLTQRRTGQHSAWLSAVLNILTQTAFRQTQS